MTTRIQVRRDTAANWAAANPILGQGEPGLDTTSGLLRIGNGSTAWSGLQPIPLKDYVDALGATTNTASTIVRRDANRYISVTGVTLNVPPAAASDATRKDYVDAIGTNANTANTVVRREGSGNANFNRVIVAQTAGDADAARKDYVDAVTSIAAAPTRIGKIAVVGGVGYLAVGTASAADWKQIT